MDYRAWPCAQRRIANSNPLGQEWMTESHLKTVMLKGQLQETGHRVLPEIADPGRGGFATSIARSWNLRERILRKCMKMRGFAFCLSLCAFKEGAEAGRDEFAVGHCVPAAYQRANN
jgi:hypothetical protein